jgi:hypothetical protein
VREFLEEQPKKTPLLQLANEGKERFQNLLAPVPASTPFTSPLHTPVLPVASRGQVSKGHFINSGFLKARGQPSLRLAF